MPISIDDVRKVAHLARLELSEAELARMARELEAIVGYVETLSRIDISGVTPQSEFIAAEDAHRVDNLREDIVRPSLPKEEALRNAPKRDEDYFLVPKVLG